jgi:tRNA-binding EMAP/Myf-like protein
MKRGGSAICRNVGGVISEGMLCDLRMLGWSGGRREQVPDLIEIDHLRLLPEASSPAGEELQRLKNWWGSCQSQ